jgi:hypothetical protein
MTLASTRIDLLNTTKGATGNCGAGLMVMNITSTALQCIAPVIPYQSSAGGWTNTSTQITTTMNVSVPAGIIINTTLAKPTCAVAERGRIWVDQGGAGVADLAFICLKNSTDDYNWIQFVIG